MSAHVFYHHPDDPQYSLANVTKDRDEISTTDRDAIVERYVLDEELFVLYTNRDASGTDVPVIAEEQNGSLVRIDDGQREARHLPDRAWDKGRHPQRSV